MTDHETFFGICDDIDKLSMNDIMARIKICHDCIKTLTIKKMQIRLDDHNNSKTKIIIQSYDNLESKNSKIQRVVYNDNITLRFIESFCKSSHSIYINESLVLKKVHNKYDFANLSNVKSAIDDLENFDLKPHKFLKLLIDSLGDDVLYIFEFILKKINKNPNKYYLGNDYESTSSDDSNSSIESDDN